MSDACNILMYACSANRDCDQTTCTEENTLLMKEVAAYGGEEALSRMKNGEKVGAVWNIFNTDDNERLRKFLRLVLGDIKTNKKTSAFITAT